MKQQQKSVKRQTSATQSGLIIRSQIKAGSFFDDLKALYKKPFSKSS